MGTFDPSLHNCFDCRKIVIDGTGPQVDWHREFSYHEVKRSQDCGFFSWTLKFPTTHLYESDKLKLYVSVDSEDLKYLNVEWRDEDDKVVSEHDTERQLYIFSSRDNNAARYIKSRPLEPSPARSVRLGQCLELYKHCFDHEKCKKAMAGNKIDTAPTRLLDVRQNSELRLRTVPQGEHPLYAALSYCWGTSQQQKDARTTRENVDGRQMGIDISQLPQSIKDAVKVTRRLELPYLWIDAFCIVQDDSVDVESEMSKMASIYRGATITISAASASDSTEGFLKNRDLKKAYGNLFQLPYHNKRADGVVEGLVLLSEHSIADTRQENIDQRAWTMQEDMLSLRLLRFGSKQTTWRCPTYPQTRKIDGGGCPALENKDYAFSVNDPFRKTEVRSNILAFGLSNDSYVEENWFNDIGEYTLRKLTNPDDRLSACAALAESFADIMGFNSSDYLAGLWKKNIHAHLLWYRPEESKAEWISSPSWSWASINGPIRFLGFALSDRTPNPNIAKYVDSSMVYESGNQKYSEVTKGRLELNGRWKYVYWDSRFLRRSSDDADVLPLKIYWDITDGDKPYEPKAQEMCCFEVFGSYRSLGLVLVIDECTGFRRAGCFEDIEGASVMRSFFDETKPQDIVLC